MQEERISLFSDYLQDDDVICIGDLVYKVKKIRSIFKELFQLVYPSFSVCLNQQGASKYGICNIDDSISDLYSDKYCLYECLKLEDSNWKNGKLKIYLSPFLYSNQSDLEKQLESVFHYSNLTFCDDDVVSFKEDCFCKMAEIRKVFKFITTSITTRNNFSSSLSSELGQSIPDFANSNLFSTGKPCGLLRLSSSNWEPLILGIQFTIDAIQDIPTNEQVVLSNKSISPLDEIRNLDEVRKTSEL